MPAAAEPAQKRGFFSNFFSRGSSGDAAAAAALVPPAAAAAGVPARPHSADRTRDHQRTPSVTRLSGSVHVPFHIKSGFVTLFRSV